MKLVLGTRSSKLAIAQTNIFLNGYKNICNWYAEEDRKFIDVDFEIKKFVTQGDKYSKEGKVRFDKINFVSDIEKALLAKEIDIAVHSAKDMPAKDNPKLKNSYVNEMVNSATADNWNKDLLIFKNGMEKIFSKDLKLGTSSLRRKMQAKFYLGAERIHNLNGNIDTRINKLNSGEYDCIVLAKAGCERLGYNLNSIELDHLTSPGQA